jgi:rhodanese-related sulfurtransferase
MEPFFMLYNLGGGFKGWQVQGGPVVKTFENKLS